VSSPRRIGLPETRRLRHESHFVEQLGRPAGLPIGRLVPIEDLQPNPKQPRQNVGDLAELVASVREKGVIEPLVVRPAGPGRFQIVAGERRYRAALEVGLPEVPCVVREVDDAEAMEIALIENLQRKDLDAFEEADSLGALAESFGYTHEKLAERLGKSRSSITEALSLGAMPEKVRELCRLADISSKSVLLQIVRQKSVHDMVALVESLQQAGGTRAAARQLAKGRHKAGPSRQRPYVFRYRPPEKGFQLAVQFRKHDVTREEIIQALRRALEELAREADGA
jgi:ParB family chromosome partitioning protein